MQLASHRVILERDMLDDESGHLLSCSVWIRVAGHVQHNFSLLQGDHYQLDVHICQMCSG